MAMKINAYQAFSLLVVGLSFLTAFIAYPIMPEKVPSHWNIKGELDGHMGKEFGVFLIPVMELFMLGLFLALPKLDPLKKNYNEFRKEYDTLMAVMIGFFYYLYLLTIAFSLGYSFNMTQFLAPGFAALFFTLGIIIEKAKQNWFVGIKTPWTLSSERVWDKTHKICGKMFKAAGVVALLGIVMPEIGLIAAVGITFAIAVFGFVYSYIEFRKEKCTK